MGCHIQLKALVKGLILSHLNVSGFVDSLQEPFPVERIVWEMGWGRQMGGRLRDGRENSVGM